MKLSQQLRTDLLDTILPVALNCPFDHSNPTLCPLSVVRQLELPERLEWLNSLDDESLSYLAAYHCVCYRLKSDWLQTMVSH